MSDGGWDGGQLVPMRACERCGSGADMSKGDPLCAEVGLAFGVVSWLCIDCRKEWHRYVKSLSVQDEYAEASLRLDFWKTRISPDTPEEAIDEGIRLLKIVDDCEKKVNDYANEWLIASPDELRAL